MQDYMIATGNKCVCVVPVVIEPQLVVRYLKQGILQFA